MKEKNHFKLSVESVFDIDVESNEFVVTCGVQVSDAFDKSS